MSGQWTPPIRRGPLSAGRRAFDLAACDDGQLTGVGELVRSGIIGVVYESFTLHGHA